MTFTPTRITIHCSDTPNGKPVGVEQIRKWHIDQNKWSDIGYHFVIGVDGAVHPGRPLDKMGAHVQSNNIGNIGICLEGRDKYAQPQFASLRGKLDTLRLQFDIDLQNIFCHYEFESAKAQGKSCPNIRAADLMVWYLIRDERAIEKYLLTQP